VKISLKTKGNIKTFADTQNLKEIITSRPTFQEKLKVFFFNPERKY
jgi:hypothetical protein